MTCGELPDEDDVVHYVRPTTLRPDGSLTSGSFRRRTNRPDENELSVSWVQFWSNRGYENPLGQIRKHFGLTPARAGKFAEFNVGRVKHLIQQEWQPVRVIHTPDGNADPSHSQIEPFPHPDTVDADVVGSLIARNVKQLHDARAN